MNRELQWLKLVCRTGHVHLMTLEQALRIDGESCYWCGTPIRIVFSRRRADALVEVRERRHDAVTAAAGALDNYWRSCHADISERQGVRIA